MELKSGYKRSEVGAVPEDWYVRPLAAIADKIMVGIASAATHAYRATGIPMFRNQNIKVGYLDDTDLLFLAPEYEVTYRNKRLRCGDLLTARTGYPGVTAIVPSRYDSAQSFTTLITRPKHCEIESGYLCHFINSEIGQAFFSRSQIGGAQKNVNAGTLRLMPIAFPKPPEQRAIAGALRDVDALLDGLDRQIAKKRDLKQAAMQQLLTGCTRLPGFCGEWVTKTLGELALRLLNGGTPSTDVQRFWQGDIPWISGADIANQEVAVVRRFTTIDGIRYSSTNVVEKGNLLIVTRTGVGKLAIAPFDVAISQDFTGVFLDDELADTDFVFRYLDANSYVLKELVQGTSISGITRQVLTSVAMHLPPTLDEQRAIARVFSDMDAEIAALEKRRDKTRALKQAMMQELLTGKTRLISPRESAEIVHA